MGFNGIPTALLASSHPLGTIFSAIFISYIQVGGDAMQPEFVKEIIDIIIAAIILSLIHISCGSMPYPLSQLTCARLDPK